MEARLRQLEPAAVYYLAPAVLATLIGIAVLRYIASIVRGIQGPSWHPGDSDLSKAGTSTETSAVGGEREFDVIIVGGGCCGCILASRCVLLLLTDECWS